MGKKEELQNENKRRVEEIEKLTEAHTRTERHLEQYADISRPEQIEHAKDLQKKREKQIDNLENIIVTGQHNNEYDE